MSNEIYASTEVEKIKIDDDMTFFHKENIVSNDLKDNQYIVRLTSRTNLGMRHNFSAGHHLSIETKKYYFSLWPEDTRLRKNAEDIADFQVRKKELKKTSELIYENGTIVRSRLMETTTNTVDKINAELEKFGAYDKINGKIIKGILKKFKLNPSFENKDYNYNNDYSNCTDFIRKLLISLEPEVNYINNLQDDEFISDIGSHMVRFTQRKHARRTVCLSSGAGACAATYGYIGVQTALGLCGIATGGAIVGAVAGVSMYLYKNECKNFTRDHIKSRHPLYAYQMVPQGHEFVSERYYKK
jgi:hypothetical protein